MVISVSGRFNAIKIYQKLPVDSSNTKQPTNHVKCAWNMNYDYEQKCQTVSLFEVIPGALRLVFDCNVFLETYAMC